MSDVQALNIDTTNDLSKRQAPDNMRCTVFNYPYSWKSWTGFWHNIWYFFKCWRPAWHRATRGFARCDTWNVDYSLTCYLINVLIEYRNCTNGWPDQEFPTFQSWIEAIDLCIDQLIYSNEDPDKLNTHHDIWFARCCGKKRSEWGIVEQKIYERYIAEVQVVREKQDAARKKAFEFLGEYLPHIWW